MNSKKLYFIMVGLVCLMVAGLIGGAYGANVLLQNQSKTVIQARSKSLALEQQQSQLIKAKASIAKYQDVGNIAKSIVPTDKDQAQTIREIVNIASENGVRLSAITFPSSTLGGAGAGGTLSQLLPAKGLSGVYTLQLTATSDNENLPTYDQFISFMAALERNRRTALVSAVSLQPSAKEPSRVSFTLTIDEYIKP